MNYRKEIPSIAIVGRPNVGKSTVFNRLTLTRDALVHDQPGVTRDRKYGVVDSSGLRFTLIDTGGLETMDATEIHQHIRHLGHGVTHGIPNLTQMIREQVSLAISECGLILFVVDARAGLLPEDEEIARSLRTLNKPILLVLNKVDGRGQDDLVADFYSLGLESVVAISAEHARGIGKLLDHIEEMLPEAVYREEEEEPDDGVTGNLVADSDEPVEGADADWEGIDGDGDRADLDGATEHLELVDEDDGEGEAPALHPKRTRPIRVAIVGRPNVGKSTLLNKMLGENRALVSEVPGTTRDSIDSLLKISEERQYILIDTAGLRRRARIRLNLERWAGSMTIQSVERADVCLLVVDGSEGPSDQDLRIARIIEEHGKGLIILLNKWDLVESADRPLMMERTKEAFSFVSWAPILNMSALTGRRVNRVPATIDSVAAERQYRINTSSLNRLVTSIQAAHRPPAYRSRPVKLLFATQVSIEPPAIVVFTNQPDGITPQYARYFTSRVREQYPFTGSPLRIFWRERSDKGQ